MEIDRFGLSDPEAVKRCDELEITVMNLAKTRVERNKKLLKNIKHELKEDIIIEDVTISRKDHKMKLNGENKDIYRYVERDIDNIDSVTIKVEGQEAKEYSR